jgi:hypothetical protein
MGFGTLLLTREDSTDLTAAIAEMQCVRAPTRP